MGLKITADFTGISSSFEPLVADATYHFRVTSVTDQADDEQWKLKNAASGGKGNPAIIIVSEVVEGDRANTEYHDYIYPLKQDGQPSKRGLGQIKAYAEALLGAEAANSPTGIDVEAFVNGEFDGVMKAESYKDKVTNADKTAIRMGKILRRS